MVLRMIRCWRMEADDVDLMGIGVRGIGVLEAIDVRCCIVNGSDDDENDDDDDDR